MTRTQKQVVFALCDLAVLCLSLVLAVMLEASVDADAPTLLAMLPLFGALAVAGLAASWWMGLPQTKLNAYEMRSVVRSAAVAALAGTVFSHALGPELPVNVFLIFGLLMVVLGVGWRIVLRQATLHIYRSGEARMRVLIYGAGQTGQQLAAALRQDDKVTPVAFVDDNPTLQSVTVAGLRVHAPSQIKDLIAARDIDRVVLAMPSISQPVQARIMYRLRNIGCDVHALPSFADLVAEGRSPGRAVPVALDQLLGRNRLE